MALSQIGGREMKRVAFVGWRGFVGSVLMEELSREASWMNKMEAHFFSTSQQGGPSPIPWSHNKTLKDAWNLEILQEMDIILTCQGSSYTKKIHPALRASGWRGYWIDSASALRMGDDSTIVLDPINLPVIDEALERGLRDFIGGNCSVSLMLMASGGLFRENLVEWVNASTYQAASGAGAGALQEFLLQMEPLGRAAGDMFRSANPTVGEMEQKITEIMQDGQTLTTDVFGTPLASNLIPWIDSEMPSGQSREEWKGQVETNKILQTQAPIPVDGTCVRVGVMRCHSQALLIKLKKTVSIKATKDILGSLHSWVEIVPNSREATIKRLHPASISGTPTILVGRIRHTSLGGEYLNIFTCGDQLLWGAALPLLRMLKKLVIGP